MLPVNDKIKVEISANKYGFGKGSIGAESGVVVAVPDQLIYFGFHSFSFEKSLADEETLAKVLAFYKKLEGKTVFWESLQDRGRRFKEGEQEYVILNMSDVIGYTDDKNAKITIVDQTGSAGSFNL